MHFEQVRYSTPDQKFVSAILDGEAVTIPCDVANRHYAALMASEVVIADYDTSPKTLEQYASAIQAHIDGVANAKGYGNGAMLASYIASTVPTWAAEASAFVAWRDATWLAAYAIMEQVQTGFRATPSMDELMTELPQIQWPGA